MTTSLALLRLLSCLTLGVIALAGCSEEGDPEVEVPSGPSGFSFGGTVTAAVHDGEHWYVGGDFTRAQMLPAPGLLSLDATGAASTTCDLGAGFDGPIEAVVHHGSSIYVGGFFGHYKGVVANRLAKLDAATCALDTTFGPAEANGFDAPVHALAVSGGALFVGGAFSSYRGGDSSDLIVKLDLVSGAVDETFTPTPADGLVGQRVNALLVSGESLYVGGNFHGYRGAPVDRIAKLDVTTGEADADFGGLWGFDQPVHALALAGRSLLVGGEFLTYNDEPALRFAKLDADTGTRVAPDSVEGFDDAVYALAVSGDAVFVGGAFSSHTSGRVAGLARLEWATGVVDTTFSPSGEGRNGFASPAVVHALALVGDALYVGGRFSTHRHKGVSTAVGHVVALGPRTGEVLSTLTPPAHEAPGFDAEVTALWGDGNTLWIGGAFAGIGGREVNRIARVHDRTLELDTTFSPPGANGFDGPVSTLLVSGGSLYVGGGFTAYRGEPDSARGLARLDLTTGALDLVFSPPGARENGVAGEVRSLAIAGASLFVGGSFSAYRFHDIRHLAKVDLATGEPDPTFHEAAGLPMIGGGTIGPTTVSALAVAGEALYLGGDFEFYRQGDATGIVNGLAKVDLASGALDETFSPTVDIDKAGFRVWSVSGVVRALAVSGDALFVGGLFDTYRGEEASLVAKLSLASGAVDDGFQSSVSDAAGEVFALAVAGGSLYVGGLFSSDPRGGGRVENLVRLDVDSGSIDRAFQVPFRDDIEGVRALAAHGSTLLVGGGFSAIGTTWAGRAAFLDAGTGAPR